MIYEFISIERFRSEERNIVLGWLRHCRNECFKETTRTGNKTTVRPEERKQDQIKDRDPSHRRGDSPYLRHGMWRSCWYQKNPVRRVDSNILMWKWWENTTEMRWFWLAQNPPVNIGGNGWLGRYPIKDVLRHQDTSQIKRVHLGVQPIESSPC